MYEMYENKMHVKNSRFAALWMALNFIASTFAGISPGLSHAAEGTKCGVLKQKKSVYVRFTQPVAKANIPDSKKCSTFLRVGSCWLYVGVRHTCHSLRVCGESVILSRHSEQLL